MQQKNDKLTLGFVKAQIFKENFYHKVNCNST